jgi:ATP-dependent Clp protease ATP-binding subunit ClpX
MKKNYFGIAFKTNDFPPNVDLKDFAARLFIAPKISVEKAKQILLIPKSIKYGHFFNSTTKQIEEIVEKQKNGIYLKPLYSGKMQDWMMHFGKVNFEELQYIEETYNITRDVFGDSVKHKIVDRIIDSPKAIADNVKQHIKGQPEIIDAISIPFYQHIESKRLGTTSKVKTPFLLVGKTGSGKSEMLRLFGEIANEVANIPVIRINSADCSPNSWKGKHIVDIISEHINDDSDLEKLKYAIIIFHEIDKITHYNSQNFAGEYSSDKDIDMQRDIMRLFERKHNLVIENQFGVYSVRQQLEADNFLIVFEGAFAGIEKLIANRLNVNNRIGFSTENAPNKRDANQYLLKQLDYPDLERWGYFPELLGRIGNVHVLNPLTESVVYDIMMSAKDNLIEAHKTECAQQGFTLEFTECGLRKIARVIVESDLGVRSLGTVLDKLMSEVYFNCDEYRNTTFTIDEGFVERNLSVKTISKGNSKQM